MTYYRLKEIKAPPFAYVVNRQAAVRQCPSCWMPFPELAVPLKVEILTTEIRKWKTTILAQPLMAEHWLIGDEAFGQVFGSIVGDTFSREAVQVVSWLARKPTLVRALESDAECLSSIGSRAPAFFRYYPKTQVPIASEIKREHPPILCDTCHRPIFDIPMDVCLCPDSQIDAPPFAALEGMPFEGYDFLYSEPIARALAHSFPSLVLERVDPYPSLF